MPWTKQKVKLTTPKGQRSRTVEADVFRGRFAVHKSVGGQATRVPWALTHVGTGRQLARFARKADATSIAQALSRGEKAMRLDWLAKSRKGIFEDVPDFLQPFYRDFLVDLQANRDPDKQRQFLKDTVAYVENVIVRNEKGQQQLPGVNGKAPGMNGKAPGVRKKAPGVNVKPKKRPETKKKPRGYEVESCSSMRRSSFKDVRSARKAASTKKGATKIRDRSTGRFVTK